MPAVEAALDEARDVARRREMEAASLVKALESETAALAAARAELKRVEAEAVAKGPVAAEDEGATIAPTPARTRRRTAPAHQEAGTADSVQLETLRQDKQKLLETVRDLRVQWDMHTARHDSAGHFSATKSLRSQLYGLGAHFRSVLCDSHDRLPPAPKRTPSPRVAPRL